MRVLIFGRHGWLASIFETYWQAGGHAAFVSTADVTRREEVRQAIVNYAPDLVLNAAGKTHGRLSVNIDGCEETFAARTGTALVNIIGAATVRDECAAQRLSLVHLGSGCVFDGDGPFGEWAEPNPQSWYAETKALGDAEALRYEKTLLVRLRMPFDSIDHPRNLLTKLRYYKAVVDALNSMTEVAGLLSTVEALVARGVVGPVHVVNPGPVSPYAIAARWGATRLTPDELDVITAARRSNCILSTKVLDRLGIALEPAQTAIDRCLEGMTGGVEPGYGFGH